MKTKRIARLPFHGTDVPHFVLEPNQKCNLKCTACYKNKNECTKPVSEIKREIDYAFEKRRLDSVAILGGEPTLHPDLPEIIRYIADKNIQVKILTNGLALTDSLLAEYKEAGLDIILLHVDSMQNRPDLGPNPTQKEVNELRDKLLQMIARHNIKCGLVLTLYQSTLDRFKDDVNYVLSSRYASQMLVTNYFSFAIKPLIEKYIPRNEETNDLYEWLYDEKNLAPEMEVSIKEAQKVIYDNFGLHPDAYVSSNKNPNEKRWIFYFLHALVNADGTYEILPLESRTARHLVNAYEWIYQRIYGRYSFIGKTSVLNGSRRIGLIHALLTLNPFYIYKALSIVASSTKSGATYLDKVIFIQRLASVTENGEVEYCDSCPDATVRNGRFLPVCIADFVSPVNLAEYSMEVQEGYKKLLEQLKIEL